MVAVLPSRESAAPKRYADGAVDTLVRLSAPHLSPASVRASMIPCCRAAVRSRVEPGGAGEARSSRPSGSVRTCGCVGGTGERVQAVLESGPGLHRCGMLLRTGSRRLRRNLGEVKQMLTVGSRRRAGAVDITVQWIKTSWTKQSRGGEAAARRNAAPVGFSLPRVPPGFAHFVQMSERDDFKPRSSQKDFREVGVSLRDEGDRLRVLARVEPLFGLPPRPRRPPAVRLLPGQWVHWQLNYRFTSALGIRGWSYWLDTFNIAYGPVDRDVFLSEPTVIVDECGPVR